MQFSTISHSPIQESTFNTWTQTACLCRLTAALHIVPWRYQRDMVLASEGSYALQFEGVDQQICCQLCYIGERDDRLFWDTGIHDASAMRLHIDRDSCKTDEDKGGRGEAGRTVPCRWRGNEEVHLLLLMGDVLRSSG